METSVTWPDQNLSKRLLKGLLQGRDLAAELQILLRKPVGEHGPAGELASKISASLAEALSLLWSSTNTSSNLHTNSSDVVGEVVSQINGPEPSHVDHSQCGDRSSEDSGEISTKKRSALKDRRGCYKRRKSSQSWTKITPKIEDGQAWRKYGQKDILNAQYPRAYFRCTRKYDQGCRATKQVQQIQDNPKLYQTTYIGNHTCRNILKPPQMIISDCEHPWDSADHNVIGSDHISRSNPIVPNSSESSTAKLMELQEAQDHQVKEEVPSDHENTSLDTDYKSTLWPHEFRDLELSDPSIGFLSPKNMGSDNEQDVVSHVVFSFQDRRTGSDDHDLDMDDFVAKSIDFRDDFPFDETEFPL